MSIQDWPADQRPRERLLTLGASALSDAELLAIFLRVGVKGKSAIDLAHAMLTYFGSLDRLLKAELQDFEPVAGFGPAKYAQLAACMELARRTLKESLQAGLAFNQPEVASDYIGLKLRHQTVEQFFVLWLDNQLRLIHDAIMFTGTVGQTAAYPREIARKALTLNASAVIVAHNHPSGASEPSQADIALTKELGRALQILEIRLLDHFIVAGPNVVSMRNRHDWPLP